MNEKIENQELEQMRQQFDMLKAHLSEHRQLKEEQIKATIKTEIKWKLRQFWFGAAIIFASIVYFVWCMIHSEEEVDYVTYLAVVLVLCGVLAFFNQGRKLKYLKQNAEYNMIAAQRLLLNEYKRTLTPPWWMLLLIYVVGSVGMYIAASLAEGRISGIVVPPLDDNLIAFFAIGLLIFPYMFFYQKWYKKKYERLSRLIEELEKLQEM